MSDTIHYNSSLPIPGSFKSQGEGECGKTGYITGWHGAVTCKACLKIVAQEKAQSFSAIKNSIK